MPSTMPKRTRRRVRHSARALAVAVTGAAATLALMVGPATAQTSSTNPASNFSFANGMVTSVHGTSVQVSNAQTQSESTVALQDTTTYTKRVTADSSALVASACVRVTGTGSDSKGITATSVLVSAADANGCTGPGPGNNGGPRPGFGSRRPGFNGNGNGNFDRNGTRPNRPANFAVANGPIVSVNGDKITVKSTSFQRPATASASKGKSKSSAKSAKNAKQTAPKTTTTNVVVTVGANTTITQTQSATAADVVAGKCVAATGTAGTGAVDAARVSISDPVNGECTGGFGGGFGGRFGGNGPGGGATNA